MQTTVKKSTETKEKSKGETNKKPVDELKKGAYSISTPRNYIQKSSTTDIYAQKKINTNTQSNKAPKKVPGTTSTSSNVSPMKGLLKSSPSSVSHVSTRSSYDKKPNPKTVEARTSLHSAKIMAKTSVDSARRTPKEMPAAKASVDSARKSTKPLPHTNVTVNSPTAKRKLNLEEDSKHSREGFEKGDSKEVEMVKRSASKDVQKDKKGNFKEVENVEKGVFKVETRQRTKTRTLDDNEVKVLTPDVVENSTGMMNLSRRLAAKPKAFFVDIDGDQPKQTKSKSSDEEMSYEDDFESYESDFDSYHSEQRSESSNHEEQSSSRREHESEGNGKEGKDEENMLDSGSFELRESQRSAHRARPVAMDFILERSEGPADDKKPSLDEGFQDMSTTSAVADARAAHVDVLDKPLFIDFAKSKESKRKRRMGDQLKQRAKDLLSMITLHEMSYSLFEMKPIPYDLYMATFGRSNYTQIAVQTFDDGITEEIQTEEIVYDCKWTQHPIEFSNHDIYLKSECISKKYSKNDEDYLTKFTFLVNKNSDVYENNKINTDKDYKENPLRVYFEQKDGAGSCEMLPYESYKSKIKNNAFNSTKLSHFLKKVERRVSRVLNLNTGKSNMSDLVQNSKLPFSKGYVSISTKYIVDEKLSFLKSTKIIGLVFSESKTNLLLTIHKKSASGIVAEKCIICLWQVSVARSEPVKVLVAIDNVTKGRFRGNADGIFLAALEDGSIHLWDLSEEPTWRQDVASNEKPTSLVEINTDRMTQTEIDREWNLRNRNVGCEQSAPQCALQACAYTSSAANIANNDVTDRVVGLEFVGDARAAPRQDGGKYRVVGQICSLQRIGVLTIWSIIQEKSKTTSQDTGKAFWSKMKLEKTQTISLIDHFDVKDTTDNDIMTNFNLNAAKRRLSNRKQEKSLIRKEKPRPKSAVSSEFDIDRPASAASLKNKRVLSVEKKVSQSWESGIVCYDLKIMTINKMDEYLIAKNGGEVLCCTRSAGVFKINKFCVATDTSSVTCLDVSPHLPYFLAATDSGTVNLCSMADARVLLTLDCRNVPAIIDKCQSDNKGRYVSSSTSPTHTNAGVDARVGGKVSVSSVHWSRSNPCCMFASLADGSLVAWDLTHSDISARSACARAGDACAHADGTMALLTAEGDVHVHRLASEQRDNHYLDLFNKYVTLL